MHDYRINYKLKGFEREREIKKSFGNRVCRIIEGWTNEVRLYMFDKDLAIKNIHNNYFMIEIIKI